METVKPRLAIYIIAAAVTIDVICAWLFSIFEHVSFFNAQYWSVVTATTVGYGDITPHNHIGKILAEIVMLTVVPLFAAEFSLITSLITAHHLNRHHDSLHEKLNMIMHHHGITHPNTDNKGE